MHPIFFNFEIHFYVITLLFIVSKTNLAVHEDRNRVPYVKVMANYICPLNVYIRYCFIILFIH